ncbi:MAG: TetR/AcrR family transcriptional regulator [Deltaproteobacteria bacterium]|nr:TetR/AcrR family transcriptional regulator [Deltaproteobacteria bacterium]NND30209.1 TetR/AcrR family transcriptional regulator [Myxococcales bacterium]MBT8463369.1 TetR/AcrR family transcriptional regulator [Deltaproteobacteria bacterium]MBT8480663.1 TetR/AcrR family transcriptional regulator [Deltaproteobacteria bacterium]NNK08289.1 TetR/AcrR family transcriptional regulator [Myxococcales bacterium]
MVYAKSAVSSQQIVDAAIRVLARQGYAKTSLLDIAKEAGMSKGALHYHYPTKEALIHTVLETACNAVQARTMQAWSPSDNPFAALRKSLEELWATRAERSDEALVVADLLALSLSDESLRPKLAEFYELGAQQIRAYLEQNLMSLGLEPRISPDILPRIVIGLLDGLVMQAFVDPDALSPDEVVDAVQTIAISIFTGGSGK